MTPEQKLKFLIAERDKNYARYCKMHERIKALRGDYYSLTGEIVRLQREVAAKGPKTGKNSALDN